MAMIQEMEKTLPERMLPKLIWLYMKKPEIKTINTGNITPDVLLFKAGINFREAGNKDKEMETYNRFITLYPNNENVIPLCRK